HQGEEGLYRDPYEFRRRMRLLAGKPAVIQVLRQNGDGPVNLLVPPAYTLTFGLRMQTGGVAAVRTGSPAEKAGRQPPTAPGAAPGETGDVLTKVRMAFEGDAAPRVWDQFDPMRLPGELAAEARKHPGKKWVTLTVKRFDPQQHKDRERDLEPVEWDESFDD